MNSITTQTVMVPCPICGEEMEVTAKFWIRSSRMKECSGNTPAVVTVALEPELIGIPAHMSEAHSEET